MQSLTEGLTESELLASRLTRNEVLRQLGVLASALRNLPEAATSAMSEIDWAGWRGLGAALRMSGAARDDALWFGVHSLVPNTLGWLRAYRQTQPELFVYWA